MMVRWWEHSQKGVTDGQTDSRAENTIHTAAWPQLKMSDMVNFDKYKWFTTVELINCKNTNVIRDISH